MNNPISKQLPASEEQQWPWGVESQTLPPIMTDGSPWPKISIVTPSYNQGQYLEETIRSVLLQSYPNLEYIVVDGGSKDNSVEIIRKYESQITYWVSEVDRGQSHAINKGFARATGKILAWLNSDDLFHPGTLVRVAELMCEREKTMLIGASVITEGPNTLGGQPDCRYPAWEDMFYDGRTFPQPSVFWTADLWNLVKGLDESLYYVMDYDLWLRMLVSDASPVFVDDLFSYARTHEAQKTWFSDQKAFSLNLRQKAYVVLNIAKRRGMSPLGWFWHSYKRRAKQFRQHGSHNFRPSMLQRAVLRAMFAPGYRSW